MPNGYLETALWKKSLGLTSSDNIQHLERLRTAYSIFRERAFQLTARIAQTLPDLTVHDGTHLDALWETADLIAGPSYPLNPLEGFVLGGAILLHDAALCFEAYDGGKDAVRATVEWRDAYAVEKQRAPTSDEPSLLAAADFAALRSLHARGATRLGSAGWGDGPQNQIFLIDDHELRGQYGQLVGEIAASHHWEIEDVGAKLPAQVNALGGFPLEWSVDPVKIACLLRCGDAAHIDQRRAPDFVYALCRRGGVSGDHWRAQNWLARTDRDRGDTTDSSLLFTSNQRFSKNETRAWWIAYDAVCLVDAEIKASNGLLNARPQSRVSPAFKMQRVTGVTSPEAMSHHIRVDGWQPCSAKIHVGNVESLVKTLGGKSLYGGNDLLAVMLRELIQNARDAVVARRYIEPNFGGRIVVKLVSLSDDLFSIIVEDDGVGMSERVLTGPLLDFGSSFWISDLVREEFPGLRSSRFRPVGRFGIGFYSIFMVADGVTVSSRRWDRGLDDVRTLEFPNGLTLRPTLSKGRPSGFTSQVSTRVSCQVKRELGSLITIEIKTNRLGEQNFRVAFPDYLFTLVAGLDVGVWYAAHESESPVEVHSPISQLTTSLDRANWLKKLAFADYQTNDAVLSEIERYAERLRYLKDGPEICGLAALSVSPMQQSIYLKLQTVGGLATNIHGRDSHLYVGFLDAEPASAKRDPAGWSRATPEALKVWVDEQVDILQRVGATLTEWCVATANLCEFGFDPISIGHVILIMNGIPQVVTIEAAYGILKAHGLAIFKVAHIKVVDTYGPPQMYLGYPTYRAVQPGNFNALELSPSVPTFERSFIGCLHRLAERESRRLQVEEQPSGAVGLLGEMNVLLLTVV